jgi:Ca2+/Na+ antiporter
MNRVPDAIAEIIWAFGTIISGALAVVIGREMLDALSINSASKFSNTILYQITTRGFPMFFFLVIVLILYLMLRVRGSKATGSRKKKE